VKNFIRQEILSKKMQRLKNVISTFSLLYAHSMTDACSWLIISTTYSDDAGTVIYYFGPIFEDKAFVAEQHMDLMGLYNLEYKNPGRTLECRAKHSRLYRSSKMS
jgi:hypothetical protein